jgi:hypothetical protein
MSAFLYEKRPNGQLRWLRPGDLPWSRYMTYCLLREGLIDSVLLKLPGRKRGLRLICAASVERLLESEKAKQSGRRQGVFV